MYVLGSRSDVYVGITATARSSRQAASAGAACRYWEHLVEIRAPPRPGGPEASRKVSCFRSCRPGHVGMVVVALGERQQIAGMEAAAIAAGGCQGNTSGTRGTGLMPRKHRERRNRARQRPLPAARAGPADALRATLGWLTMADARRARAGARARRRETAQRTEQVRSLPYWEQYPALQRALWHLGRGEGPLDVLHTWGDTLLAAWFAATQPPCLESLLQRAGGDKAVALRACDAVQALPRSDGKRKALDRVSRALRAWELPARGTKTIRWPPEAGELRSAGALEEVRASLTAQGRRLWPWVRARTRVVLPKRSTYASRWNHIRTVRNTRWPGCSPRA
jgi:hypothetical protein